LQSGLLRESDKGITGSQVRPVRESVSPRQSPSGELREGLRGEVSGVVKGKHEGGDENDEGLHLHNETGTSQRDELRLCDGASPSDGRKAGEIVDGERSSPSPERQEGRQSTREFTSVREKKTRRDAEPEVHSELSALQAGVSSTGECPHCESQLALQPPQPKQAVVFDPFAGSGTTLQVARALGRNGVGLDLSLEYLHLARTRLSLDKLDAWGKAKKDGKTVADLPMFKEAT
jgi:hypothetical protein